MTTNSIDSVREITADFAFIDCAFFKVIYIL